MTVVWIVLGSLAALVAIAVGVGALLPTTHRATVERVHPAPRGRVWALLTDVDGFPRWRSDLRGLEVRERDPAGRAIAWVERSRFGDLPLRVVSTDPERRLVGRIDAEDLPFGGTWTYELEDAGEGSTRLRLTEDGVVRNPFYRFVSRFLMGYEQTLRGYQDAVGREIARGL